MNVTLSFVSHELEQTICIRLRVLVCDNVKTNLIIGLPSIKYYNLLPGLQQHILTRKCREICADIDSESGTIQGDEDTAKRAAKDTP